MANNNQQNVEIPPINSNKEGKISVIGKNIFPTIDRICIALENVLNTAYVGNAICILTDMGVNFPEVETEEQSLKQKYLFLLKNAEFQEQEKLYTEINSSTREFLREISRDKPRIRIFLNEARKFLEQQRKINEQIKLKEKEIRKEEDEQKIEKNQNALKLLIEEKESIPIPGLTERIRWEMLTGINSNYKEFRDMFLDLQDDIPIRREEGWMNEIYIESLEDEIKKSKTLLQLEKVRENFDHIKILRNNVLNYHEKMGTVVNSEFLLGIKEEIDLARNGEKIGSITKKYSQMKKLVPLIIQNPIVYRDESGKKTANTQQLNESTTFGEILSIAKKTKKILDKREEKRKKVLEEQKNKVGFGKKIKKLLSWSNLD